MRRSVVKRSSSPWRSRRHSSNWADGCLLAAGSLLHLAEAEDDAVPEGFDQGRGDVGGTAARPSARAVFAAWSVAAGRPCFAEVTRGDRGLPGHPEAMPLQKAGNQPGLARIWL
jgi:hypothetical protein